MAIENKTILTRIINKNASLADWSSSDLVLKKGEIALAYVETLETTHKPVVNAEGAPVLNEDGSQKLEQVQEIVPTYLMKIGDGTNTFSGLKWLAAPASDVYPWAKKAALDIADLPSDWKAEVDAAVAAVSGKLDAEVYNTFIDDVFTPLKTTVDAFFNENANVEGLVDTLVEIQKLLDGTEGAQSLVNTVAALQDWYDKNHEKLTTIQNWYDEHYETLDKVTDDKIGQWDQAVTDSHTHTNKDVLDTITAENVHSHANKDELDKIEAGDKDKWDAIEGNVATTLKDYVKADDTEIEYILDCGGISAR